VSYDLLIRGGTVVAPGTAPRDLDIGVVDGVIAELGEELAGAANGEIDARGLHVLPGAVDAHVHLNDPGRTSWEGLDTGTRALAAGGTTSAIDMPLNSQPPVVDGAAFDAKRERVERLAAVDLALWGGLVPGHLDDMEELAARGVVGFKAFMSASGIDEFPRADDLTLYEGMARAAALGLPVAVHAENEAITTALAARARARSGRSVRDYLASRPAVAEIEAIGRAIALAEDTGCALHVVHVSTGGGVALVTEARARGFDVTCETCPHYLVLTDEDAERLGAIAKCAPPLRAVREVEALWTALARGELPIVASDHSPAPAALKSGEDAFAWWGGISGAQTLLALLLTNGHHGRGLPLELIASVTSASPARRFRLSGKGTVAVGADADLVLVDLDAEYLLAAEELEYRHKHSPFVGLSLRARVVRTLVRGGAGRGRLLTPAPTDSEERA
jgi:allantoinase